MREFKYGVGVIATIFLLNLLLVKLSEKSSTKTDFWGKNQKDMSHDGSISFRQHLRYYDKVYINSNPPKKIIFSDTFHKCSNLDTPWVTARTYQQVHNQQPLGKLRLRKNNI